MLKLFFSLIAALFIIAPVSAAGGSIALTTSNTNVAVGDTFTVRVAAGSNGVEVNTIGADVSYPADLLQATTVSGASAITLGITKGVTSPGSISIEGGILPAKALSVSPIGTITFKALKVGNATVAVAGSSGLYANDGQGTNILAGRGTVVISITAPTKIPDSNNQIPNTNVPAPVPPPELVPEPVPEVEIEVPQPPPAIAEKAETALQTWWKDWNFEIVSGASALMVILGLYFIIRSFTIFRKKHKKRN